MQGPFTTTFPNAVTAWAMKEIADRLQDFGMHAPMGSALESVQAVDALDAMARSAKLLIAGRQLMCGVKNVFDQLPKLGSVRLAFHSSAYDVNDGVAGYHDADVLVLESEGEPTSDVEAALLAEGLSPDVLRALMGVDHLEDGHLTVSVTRDMIEGRPTPELLAEACFKAIPNFERDVLIGFGHDDHPSQHEDFATKPSTTMRQRFA